MTFLTIEATFDQDGYLHIEGAIDLKGKRARRCNRCYSLPDYQQEQAHRFDAN